MAYIDIVKQRTAVLAGLEYAAQTLIGEMNAIRELIGLGPLVLIEDPAALKALHEKRVREREKTARKRLKQSKREKEAAKVRAEIARHAERDSDAETLKKFRTKLKTGTLLS
jgi:hypothetical protein